MRYQALAAGQAVVAETIGGPALYVTTAACGPTDDGNLQVPLWRPRSIWHANRSDVRTLSEYGSGLEAQYQEHLKATSAPAP